VPLHLLAVQVQLVVLLSAFAMVSTVWSVFFFAVLLLVVPPCQRFRNVVARAPCFMESAPLDGPVHPIYLND